MTALYFKLSDNFYQLCSQASSPFAKRQTPIKNKQIRISQQLVLNRPEWYELHLLNNSPSYHIKPKYALESKLKIQTRYSGRYLTEIPGNKGHNIFRFKIYLKEILRRFEHDLDVLPQESQRIRSVCDKMGYQIKEFQTFRQIKNNYDFLQILKSLIDNKSHFYFDLAISCIIQYSHHYQRENLVA